MGEPTLDRVQVRVQVRVHRRDIRRGRFGQRLASFRLLNGPLRLWDQVEDALETWQGAGAPDQTAFGMTATAEDQIVWMGAPDGPSWRLPN